MGADFKELIGRKEDLHPDLVPYIENSAFGKSLKHPLVFQIFYTPDLNSICNEAYRTKKEYINKAKEEKDWHRYIWMHERPYRMERSIHVSHDLKDDEYWSLLGSIWSDSENLWQYGTILGMLLSDPRPGRDGMMDDEEKKFLESLPEEFTIYRGHQVKNRLGYSWTLSYWRAKWFAQRFQNKRQGVVKARIKKSDVVAVLLGRNEFEIVAAPSKMKVSSMKKLPDRPEWMEAVKIECEKQYNFAKNYSVHGPWHWEKVERNALAIAKKTPGSDQTVVQLFSFIHDSKRENEDHDPEHGLRAAAFAEELHKEKKLPISDHQLSLLMEACKFHNDGQVSSDPTIGACWDADRLDLTRVGVIPDPKLLSTDAAKKLLWKI